MRTEINLRTWNRYEHFQFFKDFDNPFWGVSFRLDCSRTHKTAKSEGISFFSLSLYRILKAVNAIEAFRLRIESGKVYKYSRINVSATIARQDNTFGFSFTEYSDDFSLFNQYLQVETERVKKSKGLALSNTTERMDTIHFSAIPWIPFTALEHAQHFAHKDSIPKISTGKLIYKKGKILMPFSVHAHHALADGFQAGLLYQKLLEEL